MDAKSHDLAVLRDWSESAAIRLARRSWLVLESLKGVKTRELAVAVAMTEQRIEECLSCYKQLGLIGLFEKPRSGKPLNPIEIPISKLIAVLLSQGLDFSAHQIAEKLGVSSDAVRREARVANLTINRMRKLTVSATTQLSSHVPILACVFSSDFQAIVIANSPKIGELLEPVGVIDGMSTQLRKALASRPAGWVWLEDLINKSTLTPSEVPVRRASERRKRTVERLDYLEKQLKCPVKIFISGNVIASDFSGWIKAFQRSQFWEKDTRARFQFYPNVSALLSNLLPNLTSESDSGYWLSNVSQRIEMLNEELVWYRAS